MKWWLFAIAFSLAVLGVLAVLVCVSLHGEGVPAVGTSIDVASPDGRLIATVEQVDNGLGFGQGMLYDEVHVSRYPKPKFEHGDADPTVVFYEESSDDPTDTPRVTWIDSQRLRITVRSKTKAGRKLSTVGPVSIEYVGSKS